MSPNRQESCQAVIRDSLALSLSRFFTQLHAAQAFSLQKLIIIDPSEIYKTNTKNVHNILELFTNYKGYLQIRNSNFIFTDSWSIRRKNKTLAQIDKIYFLFKSPLHEKYFRSFEYQEAQVQFSAWTFFAKSL